MSSLLSFKVLIGIVLLGKAHQSIDENRRTVRARDVASQPSDVKPVSKDDLDLLPVTRSLPAVVDPASLRRTQSLSQFVPAVDDPIMVNEIVLLLLPSAPPPPPLPLPLLLSCCSVLCWDIRKILHGVFCHRLV